MATTAKLTLGEFLALPETKPALEYAAGEVFEKAMGTTGHALVQHLLSLVIGLFLRANPIGVAAPEWRCIFGPLGEEQARVPDFVFITNEHAAGDPLDGPHRGAPDLAVEVLSPDDRPGRVLDKIAIYLRSGVRLVWVIDPLERTVIVFAPQAVPYTLTDGDALDGGDVLPGFRAPVADILPPLPS